MFVNIFFVLLIVLSPHFEYSSFYERIKNHERSKMILQKDVVIFVDYSKPINKKRLHILDNKKRVVLASYHVGHAFNTGDLVAIHFSNRKNSRKSSLGLFRLLREYDSRFFEYSYRIEGLDRTNNNAFARGVVIHEQGDEPGVIFPTKSKARFYQLLTDGCFSLFPNDLVELSHYLKPGVLILAVI